MNYNRAIKNLKSIIKLEVTELLENDNAILHQLEDLYNCVKVINLENTEFAEDSEQLIKREERNAQV